jgi:hypothetical protein
MVLFKEVKMKDYNIPNTKLTVDGETAIKPYWYLRRDLLHIRYTVDRCIKLSDSEVTGLKLTMTAENDKQKSLAKAWSFFANTVKRAIIKDGIAEIDKYMEERNGR